MKKLSYTLLLCIFGLTTSNLQAQCLPDGITFSSQAQIDAFPADYPGCTIIEGDVIILESEEGDIISLDSLYPITKIEGSLSLGDSLLSGNASLFSLSGLNSIVAIDGSLTVDDNNALTSFSGLDNLDSSAQSRSGKFKFEMDFSAIVYNSPPHFMINHFKGNEFNKYVTNEGLPLAFDISAIYPLGTKHHIGLNLGVEGVMQVRAIRVVFSSAGLFKTSFDGPELKWRSNQQNFSIFYEYSFAKENVFQLRISPGLIHYNHKIEFESYIIHHETGLAKSLGISLGKKLGKKGRSSIRVEYSFTDKVSIPEISESYSYIDPIGGAEGFLEFILTTLTTWAPLDPDIYEGALHLPAEKFNYNNLKITWSYRFGW